MAFVLGAALGVMAPATLGGLTNTLIMRTMDIFYAFPAVLLAIAISGALGPGLANTLISLSIVFVPRVVRVAESATVQVKGARVHRGRARERRRGAGRSCATTCWPTCSGPVLVFSSTQVSLVDHPRRRASRSSGSASRRPPPSGASC